MVRWEPSISHVPRIIIALAGGWDSAFGSVYGTWEPCLNSLPNSCAQNSCVLSTQHYVINNEHFPEADTPTKHFSSLQKKATLDVSESFQNCWSSADVPLLPHMNNAHLPIMELPKGTSAYCLCWTLIGWEDKRNSIELSDWNSNGWLKTAQLLMGESGGGGGVV